MRRMLLWLVLALTVSACSSELMNIAPTPPARYVVASEGEGGACGVLLFGVIPIGVNSRTERAYQQALENAQATGLMESQVADRWYYIGVGEMLCTDIHGMGYRSGQ
ncbi:MAG: hypothetical protein WA005_18410 [Candidatus Binataceae bacterium]